MKTRVGPIFLPSLPTVEVEPWRRDIPDSVDLPRLVEPGPVLDPALAQSICDVFARCAWCGERTRGVLVDCADPHCPGGAL